MDEIVRDVGNAVRQRMAGQGAGHGMDHVNRVLVNARAIQSVAGGDRLVIELAALLHDVGDAKFHDGVERSAEFSREILLPLGLDVEIIDHIAEIVDKISFRKGIGGKELTLEGQVVQDADRLDALGAIGIVRTIEYGSVFDQPFYRVGDSLDHESGTLPSGIGHFHQKLFKLRRLMNTEAAREIAGQREEFMREFLKQYFRENGELNESV